MILLIVSCSSEDSTNNPLSNSDIGTKIKTLKKFTSAGTVEETVNYEYNYDGDVLIITKASIYGEVITDFIYDADGKLTSFIEVSTDPFNDIRTEVNNLQYAGDLIVQICQAITYNNTTSSFDEPEVDRIAFFYDSAGNVNLYEHYYDEDADYYTCDDVQSLSNTEDLIFDENGNMVYYENSDYFFTPFYYEYTYDNTHNVFANVKPDAFRKLFGYSTVNNINLANEYNADTDELEAIITYDYTFNASDFPTVLERTYSTVSGGIAQVIRYEYTYY